MKDDPMKINIPTKIEYIAIGKLSIQFANCQRRLRPQKVQNLVDKLDESMLGTVNVSLPDEKGTHHIIDGQHRVVSLRKFGFGPDTKIRCEVHQTRDPAIMAHLFFQLNDNRSAVNAIDKFINGVTAQYPDYVGVAKVVKAVDFEVGYSAKKDG